MSVGGVNLGQNFSVNGPGTSQGQASGVSGDLGGMSVTVADDPGSALQDSAEELTFAKDNSRQTKLADRKQKASENASRQNLERLKKAMEKVAANEDTHARQQTLRYWKADPKSSKDLLENLKKLGGHSSSNYAFLLLEAQKPENAEVKELLQQAADELFDENKSEIMAAANSLPAFEGESFASVISLSETYSDIANKPHDPQSLLDYLDTKFGKENLQKGIDCMFKALACDLSAASPSREENVLKDLASTLAKTKTLNSSLNIVNSFVTRIKDTLKLDSRKLNADQLLLEITKLSKSRFITSLHVQNLYRDKVKTSNPQEEVLVAQELLRMERGLAEELFNSPEDRVKLLDGTQRLVDELIDKEDEWLESGGA